MDTRSNFTFVFVAIIAAIFSWTHRYDIHAVSHGENWPIAFVLDRFTGEITACVGTACHKVEQAK
jgi:hypothetical protein